MKVKYGNQIIEIEEPCPLKELLECCSVAIDFPCGGAGICGKCKVQVHGKLSPLTEQEGEFLSQEEIEKGIRLACYAVIQGDCEIVPMFETGTFCIQSTDLVPDFETDPLHENYGVAIDLGSTTVVIQLFHKDRYLGEESFVNPQTKYGADVMSRIDFALQGGIETLGDVIQKEISQYLTKLCKRVSLAPTEVEAVVMTGNTAMLYFFTKRNPQALSKAPFEADTLFGEVLEGKDYGLPCGQLALYLPPCVSAFVGADLLTALFASSYLSKDTCTLLIDIGTNGEMAVGKDGRYLCCATAAGPAFQESGISMGMSGKSGAVSKLWLEEGELCWESIGEDSVKGICGSGIVDLLSMLLTLEEMDETGKLLQGAFSFAGLTLTQKDVRQVQLAKSAIYAGMVSLLSQGNISVEEVETLWIAGGFGTHLDIHNAAAIQLILPQLEGKAKSVGNLALTGARMMLLQKQFWTESFALRSSAVTVDLSRSKIFQEAYTDGMFF